MSAFMTLILDIVMAGLLISLILTTYRLMRGPTLADRAVAGDQVAIHVVVWIGIDSIKSNQPILLDLLIVTAIVGFLSLAVIGIYIERAARGKIPAETKEQSS